MEAVFSIGPNGEMGYKGKLMAGPLVACRADMFWFVRLTRDQLLVAGRATAQSMTDLGYQGGRGRSHYYLSNGKNIAPIGVFSHAELSAVPDYSFIIGGAKTLSLLWPRIKIAHVLTRQVHGRCDTYFDKTLLYGLHLDTEINGTVRYQRYSKVG